MTPPTSLLSGYRILDLTDEIAAYGTRLLADWGAEVIKVEPPSGDPMRHEPPFVDDVLHPEHSLSFMAWHINKKSITLNRHCANGRALLQALLHTADALVWSGQSDYLADSQLNEATLRTQYPKLIFTTASGFGQTGPHAYFASSDLVAQAMGGVMWMSGHADGPPICPGGNLSFILTGLYTAVGTLSALWHRQRTGEGQHVDISQQDSVASILAELGASSYWASEVIPQRYGTHRPDFHPNGLYPCHDGYLMLIVLPTDWSRFAEWVYEVTNNATVLAPQYADNEQRVTPEARMVLDPILTAFTQHFDSKDVLFHEGQRRHFLFAPVNTVADLMADRHLHKRSFWQQIEPPGAPPLTAAGNPINTTAAPAVPLREAPTLGAHNLEIYAGELGLSPYQLTILKAQHVI